jgi:hypothetical protein
LAADDLKDEISELDINPILIYPRGTPAFVADALVVTA